MPQPVLLHCIVFHSLLTPLLQCSVTCGEGFKRRLVKCVNLKGKTLESSQCNARKPPESVRCAVPCVKWVPGKWEKVRYVSSLLYTVCFVYRKKFIGK